MSAAYKIKENLPRLIAMAFGAFFVLYCSISTIYFLATGNDPGNRLAAVIGGAFLGAAPFLIELIFRFKFSGFLLLFYMLYVFFASFLGSVLSFYKIYAFYDKIVHFAFGYVGGIAGLFLFCNLGNAENKAVFIVIFCFAVSLSLGAIWEVFEFIGDTFFSQTAQGAPILWEGEKIVPVTDTMLDIIMNLGGAVVFCIHYALHAITKKGLLIDKLKGEFKLIFSPKKENIPSQ